ncbi:MarR family EPS-associated transcriptional regulator [Marinomonas sp. 2405UD66-6]|uniref:MarR family EPS-associated transcriptional regulator n=1 Tax=Marinomonas sp. 2405UD66-6 TaxID=3391834 RepID=UPI0039C9F4D2
MLTEEDRYKILKEVQKNPDISQRELARRLGISLGKANFCLKVLIEKGLIKTENFKNNTNKVKYLYPRIQLRSAPLPKLCCTS